MDTTSSQLLYVWIYIIFCKFEHENRLNGYILTSVAKFSGAAAFIFVDLFAFVIANLIQTYIAFQGYYKNKKAGEEQKIN